MLNRALFERLALTLWGVGAITLFAGCGSDNNDEPNIVGPDLPEGPGRVYPVSDVTFKSIDGIAVSGLFGQQVSGSGPHPVVILVHDVGNSLAGDEWVFSGLFEELLEGGYGVLAIDMRGHGDTPLPKDGRENPVLLLSDLPSLHLDVRAGITWLRLQGNVDNGRIAVVGNGGGGNVAYVAMGAFPDDLRAGVALSPGLWDQGLQPLIMGSDLDPFAPHSMLYLVGDQDVLSVSDTESLSYRDFATLLASRTVSPKNVTTFSGVDAHGIDLLQASEAVDLILGWLDTHL
ncbi:MAG: alpha/beta fold hydrolase [Candidatus Latescibacterota bacterium]|nr:alpha/beta fold hydrolase [Candidatus Latescibacterota bacterium]